MFEFKRVELDTMTGTQKTKSIHELNRLGLEGWEIRGVIRNVTGNNEVVYLQRELEEVE